MPLDGVVLVELLEWVAHFRDFWDKKILVIRDLKIGRFSAAKVTIDYNGVGVVRGQRHITSKN